MMRERQELREYAGAKFMQYHGTLAVLHDQRRRPIFDKYIFRPLRADENILDTASLLMGDQLHKVARSVVELGGYEVLPEVLELGTAYAEKTCFLTCRPDGTLPNPLNSQQRLDRFYYSAKGFELEVLMDGVTPGRMLQRLLPKMSDAA